MRNPYKWLPTASALSERTRLDRDAVVLRALDVRSNRVLLWVIQKTS